MTTKAILKEITFLQYINFNEDGEAEDIKITIPWQICSSKKQSDILPFAEGEFNVILKASDSLYLIYNIIFDLLKQQCTSNGFDQITESNIYINKITDLSIILN